MTARPIELRSDTFTRPTEEMRLAMYRAEVGDDVWNEDPTVQRLEERAAQLTGKEAALFVASGTQGNLVGVLSHTRSGDEFIAGAESHIVQYEVAGTAVVGGLQLRTVSDRGGQLRPDDVGAAIRGEDIHAPRTGCVALENTHNRCGGAVTTVEGVQDVAEVARRAGIPTHMDGARVFNAAVALGVPVERVVAPVDSVTFCLSKGLGAPVGSLLCGRRDYIERARKWRKLLGGGMRQVGILAAAGLVALEANIDRLAEDHAHARRLAEGMANIDGMSIDPDSVASNIVIADISTLGMTPRDLATRLLDYGVRVAPFGPSVIRAVTSYEITGPDIDVALQAMQRVSGSMVLAPV